MKIEIAENSPDKLLVKMTPESSLAMTLGAIAFILGAFPTSYILGFFIQLDLGPEQLTMRSALFNRYFVSEQKVDRSTIQEFEVEVRSTSMYVVAKTDSKSIDVPVDASMDGDDKHALANDLNDQLNSDGTFHQETGIGRPIAAAFLSCVLLLAGLYCLFALQTVWIYADTQSNLLCVRAKRWLSLFSQRSIRCMAIKNFEYVDSKEWTVGSNTGTSATSYHASAVDVDGQSIPLATSALFTDHSREEIKQLLETWVGQAKRQSNA